jgi:ribosomal protein L37AE/L43A
MAEPAKPSLPSSVGVTPQRAKNDEADKVICERCGQAEMFRMHAVWRCPNCGYKTDCCGW